METVSQILVPHELEELFKHSTIEELVECENPDPDPIVIAHYYTCPPGFEWYVIAAEKHKNGKYEFFGIARAAYTELGYFTQTEIEELSVMKGVTVLRDCEFVPRRLSSFKFEEGA